MPLEAGTLYAKTEKEDRYSGSMAEAIENAFMKEWPYVMAGMELPVPTPQMRLMFIAIAQGVVRYLVEHPDSFEVRIVSNSGHTHSATVTISTKGVLHK